MSDTVETTPAAVVEAPVQAPQPVEVPQAAVTSQGGGWFKGAWGAGIAAAVVVVVAGAFFTIGWFTSARGDDERFGMMNVMQQRMNQGDRGGLQGGCDQQGAGQGQCYRGRGQGMMVPQLPGQGMKVPQLPGQGQGRGQGWSQGQGQIIPATPVQPSSPSAPQGQVAQQGYLGVGVRTVTPQLQQQFGLALSAGVLVASIDGSGPAFKAGIQQGDIITGINGVPVMLQDEVVAAVANMRAGDSVSVTVDRNGQSLTIQVTLAAKAGSISG